MRASEHGDGSPAASSVRSDAVDRALRRQVPLLFATYAAVFAGLAGVALVQPELQRDLGLSPAAYGLAATGLLAGFLVCAVPSNVLMARIGARLTLSRILACMGAGTAALAFVTTANEFVATRFLTGVLAAGLAPGLKLYVTYWYPADRRAGVFATLLLAPVVGGALLGPVTAWLLATADGVGGLRAWQWLFLGLSAPCFVLAAVVARWLDDRPSQARWLDTEQRAALERAVSEARSAVTVRSPAAAGWVARARASLSLATVAAAVGFASATLVHVVPVALRRSTDASTLVNVLSAAPYLAGGLAAVLWGRRSDRTGERRRHFAAACVVAAAGLGMLATGPGLAGAVLAAMLAFAGVMAAIPVYWPVPLARLSAGSAAVGIGVLQVAHDLGAALAPLTHGVVLDATGSMSWGLLVTAAIVLAAALQQTRILGRSTH